jgi:Ca-activated chloride channel family protein
MRTALLALALLLLAPAAWAQETMLILDASNSMWGRVEGRPKIVIAREAVAALARSVPPGTRMGLMAYGHRRAGDCNDIETLIPPGPVDAAAFAARANALTPRGRTPLAASIARAAEAGVLRIILLSDGIETCVPDACAEVRALRARGVNVTVHVIGFDIAEARDRSALACIAEATGGRFLAAANAAELGAALAAAAEAAPPPPPPAETRRDQPLETETNLTLEASEIEGGPAVPATWTLLRLSDPPATIFTNNGRMRPEARVPPGRYEVRVFAGTARLRETFEVEGDRHLHRVVLNLGTLRASGGLVAGAPPFGGNWTVIADEVPGARSGEQVTTSGAREPQFRLVQGSYRVRFQAGIATAEADVFVEAGRTETLRLDLDAAEAVFVATRGGAPVAAQLWEVRRPGEARAAASSGAARGRFVLPAGRWLVRVREAGVWHETEVSLRPGQTGEVAIPLP